jgi:hypothetical protein
MLAKTPADGTGCRSFQAANSAYRRFVGRFSGKQKRLAAPEGYTVIGSMPMSDLRIPLTV